MRQIKLSTQRYFYLQKSILDYLEEINKDVRAVIN